MADGLSALAHELMLRELQKNPTQFEQPVASPESRGMHPETIAMMGGVADAASTYTMLKRGTKVEGNAMFHGMKPAATAAMVAGSALGMKGLRALLRKKSGWLADALAANQGAHQIGLAVHNVDGGRGSSDVRTFEAIRRGLAQR